MKKLIALLLALVMVMGMVACGTKEAAETEAAIPTADAKASEAAAVTEGVDAVEGEEIIVKADEVSDDERAAALGIPGAVVLQDTDVLEGKRIGCSIVYKGDEWCAALSDALEALADYYGVDNMTCEDGELNDEKQVQQIENMVANKVDIMIIDPTTPDGTGEALNKAYDAGIPIIIYDGYWSEGAEKAATTITWDQVATGTMIGEYFVEYIKANSDGKARVIELTNAVSTHCQERFVGLHAVFEEANANGCEIEILDKYDSQGNREMAYNAIAAVVQPYDYVISDVDNGAMGARAYLESVGNTDVKVFTMGGWGPEPFGLLHAEDPNYIACLNVDPWVLAQFCFDAAIAVAKGEELPVQTNIALFVVDSANVDQFWNFD